MEAKVSDAGTLEGHADLSSQGDVEYMLRSSFRAVPLPQWKELAQRISFSSGFGGDVSEVTASSPEKTDEPFHFAYKYTSKEFGDWANRRILAPSPVISLPAADEERLPVGPLWLGSLTEMRFHSRVELPGGYQPELPVAIHLKRDFALYDSTYDFKDRKLISERHLKTLMCEVPVSEREEYKQFVKALLADYGVYISLSSATGSSMAAASKNSDPDRSNAEAARLENDARDEIAKHDLPKVASLYRAVSADPKFTRAWVILGGLLLMQHQVDAGVDAFHKAMAADPAQHVISKALGMSLMAASQFEEAVPVWQDYVKAHPDDVEGPANLGNCFVRGKPWSLGPLEGGK